MKITKELIADLINQKKIVIKDNDGESMCWIGDYNFYYGWWGESLSTEEIIEKYGQEEIVNSIYNILKSEEDAENNGIYEDEYGYYVACIEEMVKGA